MDTERELKSATRNITFAMDWLDSARTDLHEAYNHSSDEVFRADLKQAINALANTRWSLNEQRAEIAMHAGFYPEFLREVD